MMMMIAVDDEHKNKTKKKERRDCGSGVLVPVHLSPKSLFISLLYPLLAGFGLDLFVRLEDHRSLALWLQFLLVPKYFLLSTQNNDSTFPSPFHEKGKKIMFGKRKKGGNDGKKEEEEKEEKKGTYPSQSNKFANLAPLLLKAQPFAPRNRARVVPRPLARRPLVVKVGNLVELRVGEQPKVEQRRGEGRVHLSARELHEGRQGQRHLPELGVEGWVSAGSSGA